jgi:tetratricopeptide (TPR) repeat protein
VLDRIEDYVQHNIVPADKDLKQQYYALKKEYEKEQRMYGSEEGNANQIKKQHIDGVVAAFNERLTWWNTDFKPETLKKPKKDKKESNEANTYLFEHNLNPDAAYAVTDSAAYAGENEAEESPSAVGALQEAVNAEISPANNKVSELVGSIDNSPPPPPPPPPGENEEREGEIKIKEFTPDMPYMKELKRASNYNAVYRQLRKQYAQSPTFFLDVSEFFFKKGDNAKAVTVLSNLAEMYPENHSVMRIMGHKLQQAKQYELAIMAFKDVLDMREEEPQSYRDLGLAYAETKKYQQAVDMLCKVVNRKWDDRFPMVELIAVGEINSIIAQCPTGLNLDSLDKRLIKNMPVDVRIVINWDNDNCDMDLWVTDPLDEVCMYSNNRTKAGGMISNDFTGGYGPEEFMVKKAVKGKYLIQVNYYGTRQTTVTGPTTVQAECYTNYGRPSQQKKTITLRLQENKEVIDIGELVFGS